MNTSFDLETYLMTSTDHAPKPVCISLYSPQEGGRLHLIEDGIQDFKHTLERALDNGTDRLISHNGRFDLHVLGKHYPELWPLIFRGLDAGIFSDTLVRERLYQIANGMRGPLALGKLADKYFGIHMNKGEDGWRLRYADLDYVPILEWPEEAHKYAIEDALYTWRLWELQYRRNAYEEIIDEKQQVKYAFAAQYIENAGITTDTELIERTQAHFLKIERDLRDDLIYAGLRYVKRATRPTVDKKRLVELIKETLGEETVFTKSGAVSLSKKQIMNAATRSKIFKDVLSFKDYPFRFYKEDNPPHPLWLPVVQRLKAHGLLPETFDGNVVLAETDHAKKEPLQARIRKALGEDVPLTDTGAVKTDARTIREAAKSDPLLNKITQHSVAYNMRTKYLVKLADSPVLARYSTMKTTGRWSVLDPPLQQLPRAREIRDCVIPANGYTMLCGDFSQVELVCLGDICKRMFGKSRLSDAINRGIDAHCLMGVSLAVAEGLHAYDTYEKFLAAKEAGDPTALRLRQMSKAGNFGFPGGMGVDSFQDYAVGYGLSLNRAQALGIRNAWLETWPEMTQYLDRAAQETREGTQDDFGNFRVIHPVSGRIRGVANYTQAANTKFQGLAADGMGTAQYLIAKEALTDLDSPLHKGSYRTVMVVHDEVVGEILPEYAKAGADRIRKLMIQGMKTVVKFTEVRIDVKQTKHWEH